MRGVPYNEMFDVFTSVSNLKQRVRILAPNVNVTV